MRIAPPNGLWRSTSRYVVRRITRCVQRFVTYGVFGTMLVPVSLSAQAPRATRVARASTPAADSLLNQALASAAKGDTNSALELLEQANKIAKKDAEVLYWRGLMLARSTNLGISDIPRNVLAWHLLERAADLDPKNARYLMEMGRIRLNTPMLRIEAERLFRKALHVAEQSGDPSQLADVAWELGQIKERRYQTAKDRYMLTSAGLAFDPAQAINQKHYTREFLEQNSRPIEDVGFVDRSEAEEMYRRGLRAVPVHEANAVGVLALLYDQRRYPEMREIARPFLESNAGSARLRFAAGLAAYRTGALSDAEKLFDDALARLTDEQRSDAAGLARIIRRRDALAYDALTPASRLHTDSAYWEAADPLLSTPENEGRLEFLARVAVADLRFSSADMRQTGWRTDRGLILLRYGEPPVVATFTPSFARDQSETTGRVITVWFYPKEERSYVFQGPAAMNYASFAGDMRGYAEENRENAPFLLDNVPFAAGIDTVPVQVARFRSRTAGMGEIVVAANVDTRRLYESVELDRGALALSLRVGPPSRLRLTNSDTVPISLPAPKGATRTWIREVAPGQQRVRVEATDVAVLGAAGRAQVEVNVKPAAVGAFEVSDVLVGQRDPSPEQTVTGVRDPRVVPKGDLTIAQREIFSVYWENYGATPDKDGRVRLDVKIAVTLVEIDRTGRQALSRVFGNVADAVGLTKQGEEQLGVQFQRDEVLNGRDRIPQITNLGLGSSPPGTYRLELNVTDRTSGKTARTERIFYLSRN